MESSATQGGTFSLSAQDLDEIIRTAVDYYESWYTGNAERMKACLHPELSKRYIREDPAGRARELRTLPAQRMYDLTRQGEGFGVPEAYKKFEVTVQDAFGNIASVKAVSPEYVEYLHIGRFDNRWLIVNALWDHNQQDAD